MYFVLEKEEADSKTNSNHIKEKYHYWQKYLHRSYFRFKYQGFKEVNRQPFQVDFEMEYDEDLLDLETKEMRLLTQFDSQSAQELSFE